MIACLTVLLTATAATPPVLYDTGRTRPATATASAAPARAVQIPQPPPGCRPCRPATTTRSPGLSPGLPVELIINQVGIARPLFLIGPDAASLRWLTAQRTRLVAMAAAGLLVRMSSPAQLSAVRHAGRGLSISPGSGTALARQHGFRTYPVLLLPAGAEKR